MPIQMTRAQYEAKYGKAPVLASSTPIKMTRAEYDAKYGTTQPQEKVGFIQGLARSIASPVMRLGANIVGAKRTLEGQTKEQADAPVSYGSYLGTAKAVGQEGDFTTRVKDTLGTGVELASNIVGGGGASKVAVSGLKGLVKQGIKQGAKAGLVSGALYGGGQALQEDKGIGGVSLGVGIGGASGLVGGAVLGGAVPVAGKIIKKTANSIVDPGTELGIKPGESLLRGATWIENKIIRPTGKDVSNGFKKENLSKYGIFGNLGESLTKTSTQLSDSMASLKSTIAEQTAKQQRAPLQSGLATKFRTGETGTTLARPMQKLASELQGGDIATFGSNSENQSVLNEIGRELQITFGDDWQNKPLNFADLIALKRRVGIKAAFEHDPLKKGPSPKEEVWNKLYQILKTESEDIAGPEFTAINTKISELIPIEQAIIRRTPIEERNNAIGLIDAISLVGATHEPLSLTVGIANRLTKSGAVAKGLGSLGEGLKAKGAMVNKSSVGKFLGAPKVGMSTLDVTKDYDTVAKALMDYDTSTPTFRYMGGQPMKAPVSEAASRLEDLKIALDKRALTKTEIAEAGKLLQKEGLLQSTQASQASTAIPNKNNIQQSLLQEAKKYKTAEEFVKAQGVPVYHGGGKTFESLDEINFDEGFYMLKKTDSDLKKLENIPKGNYYSYDDLAKMPAEAFGGKVTDFVVNFNKPLVFDAKGKGWMELADDEISDFTARLVAKAKKQGSDGVIIKNIREGFSGKGTLGEEAGLVDDYIALDKNTLKTKSQLTDIWKQANPEASFSPQVQRLLNMRK